jgi:hypothetical protein
LFLPWLLVIRSDASTPKVLPSAMLLLTAEDERTVL